MKPENFVAVIAEVSVLAFCLCSIYATVGAKSTSWKREAHTLFLLNKQSERQKIYVRPTCQDQKIIIRFPSTFRTNKQSVKWILYWNFNFSRGEQRVPSADDIAQVNYSSIYLKRCEVDGETWKYRVAFQFKEEKHIMIPWPGAPGALHRNCIKSLRPGMEI